MKGKFQLVTIVVFIFLAVFGVLVFSGAIPLGTGNSTTGQGTVVLWGTARSDLIAPLIENLNNANQTFTVQYVQKSPDTFDQDLLEALAAGTGPDMFLLPDNLAYHYANKIFAIPYSSFSLSSFNSMFSGAGGVFLTSKGLLAFPLAIDPLVMYYNRSMLDGSGVVAPPSSWDQVSSLVTTLTKKDQSNKLLKSTVALGQFANVTNAKDIIAALFMQAGNPIVSEKSGTFDSTLGNPSAYDLSSILKFYTSFADPQQSVYSWNRSFPNSRDAFSAENLALYFGFASELPSLINKNPNQNFLVAQFPQIQNANYKLTAARVIGIGISSFSKNFNTAYIAASLMATGDFAGKFASALGIAPARLDLLAQKGSDAYSPTFYNSALYAKSWLDPSPKDTDDIFRKMVEAVLSNSMTTGDAVRDADSKLRLLLIK